MALRRLDPQVVYAASHMAAERTRGRGVGATSRLARLTLILAFLLALLPAPASAQVVLPTNCQLLPSGGPSLWVVCAPAPGSWNGDVVVFAHGYVAPDEPLDAGFGQLVLPDGTFIPDLANGLGYVFAASSSARSHSERSEESVLVP